MVQGPTTEQIEQIKTLSNVVYGNRGAAFMQHGQPGSREAASDLIKTLHHRRELNDTTPATKTCKNCGEDKPLDQYGKVKAAKDGLNYWCKACISQRDREKRSAKANGGKAAPSPAVQSNGDWRAAWTDPTLSQLEGLRQLLNAPTVDDVLPLVGQIAGQL